jgi:hypothetical protein
MTVSKYVPTYVHGDKRTGLIQLENKQLKFLV